MRIRKQTVEHPFGTLKAWMVSTHFLMRTLKYVSTEMLACARLQPQTRDAHHGNRTTDSRDGHLSAPSSENYGNRRACRAFDVGPQFRISRMLFPRRGI